MLGMISISNLKALIEWHASIVLVITQETLRNLDLTPPIPAPKSPEVETYGGMIE
jgi:hypothetical protein